MNYWRVMNQKVWHTYLHQSLVEWAQVARKWESIEKDHQVTFLLQKMFLLFKRGEENTTQR